MTRRMIPIPKSRLAKIFSKPWRQMRRDGLVICRVAGRAYVTGKQIIDYIETKATNAK
jgi:hypothetical protein